jgi:O-antigen/teichoic acid export membrane protein
MSSLGAPTPEVSHQVNLWPGFLSKVAGTLGARGILLFLTFLSSVISARYLGPEGRGVYAVLTVISGVAIQLGNFGLHAANTFFLGRDRSLRNQIVSNSAWISGTIGLGLIVILIPMRPWLWDSAIYSRWVYYAAIASIPFGLFYLLAQNIRLGMGQIASFNATDILFTAAGFLAVIVCLVVLRFSAGSLIVYATVFNAAAAVWLFAKLRDPNTNAFDAQLFFKMFRYGLKAYVAALFAFLMLRFDLLMVSRILGTRAAGIYSIAVQIADVLYLLPISIGLILFPEISAMQSGAWPFTKRIAQGTAIFLGACCLAVWFIGPVFIQLAYGQQFLESATALRWLLPGIWTLGINTVFMNYFAGTGMPLVTVISPAIAFCVNLTLNLVLIPKMGVAGASLASTICYSIMLLCSAIYVMVFRKHSQ